MVKAVNMNDPSPESINVGQLLNLFRNNYFNDLLDLLTEMAAQVG